MNNTKIKTPTTTRGMLVRCYGEDAAQDAGEKLVTNPPRSDNPPTTTRGMLDLIDKFLARCDEESGKLWDVLSALRGPDDKDEALKKHSTMLIRQAAFPKLQKAVEMESSSMWQCGPSGRTPGMDGFLPYKTTGCQGHFRVHANGAARVLGLLK